ALGWDAQAVTLADGAAPESSARGRREARSDVAPEESFRERLFRAANGQVYQVLQNAGSDKAFGADAIQITTVVAASADSVAQCANAAGAVSVPQAVVGAEGQAFPPASVFKSSLIADATAACFNRNASGGDGQVCIGPACTQDCACPGGAACQTFTIT